MQQNALFMLQLGARLEHKTRPNNSYVIAKITTDCGLIEHRYTVFWTTRVEMNAPYKPITKEIAAELLTVSKRTIDNWIADGTLPMPTSIGRRVYWHPDVFRDWQDKAFGIQRKTDHQVISQSRRGRPRTNFSMD